MQYGFYKKACLTIVTSLLLVACASQTLPPYPYTQLSPVQPPEAPYEQPPRSETPWAEIWQPGHWDYNGVSFSWVSGNMIPRPSATAVWAADRWDHREYGWAFVPGKWQ